MINITFTAADEEALRYERFHPPHPPGAAQNARIRDENGKERHPMGPGCTIGRGITTQA